MTPVPGEQEMKHNKDKLSWTNFTCESHPDLDSSGLGELLRLSSLFRTTNHLQLASSHRNDLLEGCLEVLHHLLEGVGHLLDPLVVETGDQPGEGRLGLV